MQQLQFKVILISITYWYLLCSKITCRKADGQDRYLNMSKIQRPKPDSRKIIKEFYFKLNECAEQMWLIISSMIGWIITQWEFKTCKADHNLLFLLNSFHFFLSTKRAKEFCSAYSGNIMMPSLTLRKVHTKKWSLWAKKCPNTLSYDYTLQKPYIGTII